MAYKRITLDVNLHRQLVESSQKYPITSEEWSCFLAWFPLLEAARGQTGVTFAYIIAAGPKMITVKSLCELLGIAPNAIRQRLMILEDQELIGKKFTGKAELAYYHRLSKVSWPECLGGKKSDGEKIFLASDGQLIVSKNKVAKVTNLSRNVTHGTKLQNSKSSNITQSLRKNTKECTRFECDNSCQEGNIAEKIKDSKNLETCQNCSSLCNFSQENQGKLHNNFSKTSKYQLSFNNLKNKKVKLKGGLGGETPAAKFVSEIFSEMEQVSEAKSQNMVQIRARRSQVLNQPSKRTQFSRWESKDPSDWNPSDRLGYWFHKHLGYYGAEDPAFFVAYRIRNKTNPFTKALQRLRQFEKGFLSEVTDFKKYLDWLFDEFLPTAHWVDSAILFNQIFKLSLNNTWLSRFKARTLKPANGNGSNGKNSKKGTWHPWGYEDGN